MELNRTIALLILAGLLMGLFGSFSFLSGMEPKFLIDVDGQRIALDDQQKSAFDKCGMFAQMFADCGSLEQINFEQLNSPVRIKTLQQLVRVINSPDTISTIINDGDCIDLYKLAEYFQAPQEIIKLTAEKAYLPVNKKIFELQKENKEKASIEHLEILKEEIIKILDYCPHFVDFLKQ